MTKTDKISENLDTTLADRIETARVRSNEFAADATSKVRDFVQDHPVATIAGGLALGALIAGAFATTRRVPIKAALTKGHIAKDVDVIAARLSKLATLGAEVAMAYAARAAKEGKITAGKLEEQLGQLSEDAGKKGTEASHKASAFADMLINQLREAGETALHRLSKRTK